jgi:outer membrane protein OmpA-like peptidoglycan-associated protein
MDYKKLFIIVVISAFTIFYTGCSRKKVDIKKPEKTDVEPVGINLYKLNNIVSKIKDNCQAKAFKDQNSSIFVQRYKSYIKIDLNEKNDFRNGSYVLTKSSKEKLSCITPIIKDESGFFIVITGHANDTKDKQKNQHLSDNRAISLAELFFNAGIRDEIFAKGCADKKLGENSKKINIYIYTDKTKIKNHCK